MSMSDLAFVKKFPFICPRCNSDNIHPDGSFDQDAVAISYVCEICSAGFVVELSVTGYTMLDKDHEDVVHETLPSYLELLEMAKQLRRVASGLNITAEEIEATMKKTKFLKTI